MRMWIAFVALSVSTPVCAQTLGSSSGSSSAINITNPANTVTRLITTPTVVSPGLAAAGIETCLGSNAGGISLMGGGFTFGSTKVDDGCTIRLLSRQLFSFGFQKAAVALMCQDDRVADAMSVTGTACPDRSAPDQSRRRTPVASFAENPASAFSTNPIAALLGGTLSSLADDREADAPQHHVLDLPVKPVTLDEHMLFARIN